MGSYAFVVGVNNYVQDPDGLQTLNGAVKDSNDFVNWLKSLNDPLPDENIFHIKSLNNNVFPKKNDAETKLMEFINAVGNNVINEKLYFYFAGHGVGHPDEVDHNLLCFSDWTKKWSNNAFASVPAISFFRYMGVFKEIIFIFDCCRTRYFRARLSEFITQNIRCGNFNDASVYIAYSTSYDDEAHEYDAIGQNGILEKRGVFTEVLLEGLKGAAANENGEVDNNTLSAYLMKEVNTLAQKKGFSQKPQCSVILGNGNDRIVFTSIPVVKTQITFHFEIPDEYILNDSKDKTLESIVTVDPNADFIRQLSKGYYTLIRNSNKEEKIFRVTDSDNAITF
ncbi:caspase domain-containing protein [Flavobacterium sp. FlaQc-52]|uniref:caspase family protein n=1 Tax=Flavobacterium sp. FlaQc-52 TaxID=3374185 RepID=UPI003756D9A8